MRCYWLPILLLALGFGVMTAAPPPCRERPGPRFNTWFYSPHHDCVIYLCPVTGRNFFWCKKHATYHPLDLYRPGSCGR
jgi:hypothetical protein